jgi:GTP-binding protein YchF
MKIGIVGFPGSGKTTLFNALTGQAAPTGFGSGRVNVGTIKVPEKRLDRLAAINKIERAIYPEITFADVPGGRGGQSLDPGTLGRIREMDALVQVVRGFDDGGGSLDPARELKSFEAELILGDMQVAEKRVERLKKDLSDPRQLELLSRCLEKMGDEIPLRSLGLTDEEQASLSGYAFLSLKPLLVVLSLPEDQVSAPLADDISELAGKRQLEIMPISGPIEAEIAALDPLDQRDFLADLGLEESTSSRFIRSAFAMLDLISFFTRKTDECRAWPIRRGSTAVEAAGAVHTDIARGFIRAEVIHFDDFDKLGGEAACKEAGKLYIQGKDYIVQDGDICHFRFNI